MTVNEAIAALSKCKNKEMVFCVCIHGIPYQEIIGIQDSTGTIKDSEDGKIDGCALAMLAEDSEAHSESHAEPQRGEHTRIATFYLKSGREVDIFHSSSGYKAQDAYLETKHNFGRNFPTLKAVEEKWQE